MPLRNCLSLFIAACALTLPLIGCGQSKPSTPATDGDHHEGHDHDGHDHAAHAHPTHGPHEGDLIELGNEEYHAEMLHDEATHKVTIYILDAHAEKEIAVAEDAVIINAKIDGKPKQYPMIAIGATDGKASHFEVVDEALMEAIESDTADAQLSVTVEGNPYLGKIAHHDH